MMTLRERALELLLLTDADRKARETQALDWAGPVDAGSAIAEPAGVPGRPAQPVLVPRTLEARGLDASPPMQAKLRGIGDARGVAIGNRWYRWLCERAGLDPVAQDAVLTERHQAPRLQPPFNEQARLLAGFSAEELARLPR